MTLVAEDKACLREKADFILKASKKTKVAAGRKTSSK